MIRLALVLAFLMSLLTAVHPAVAQLESEKRERLLSIAEHHGGPNFAATSARIRLGIDTAFAYRQLDTLLSRPYGDMFWMYGCAGLYYATQDVLRPAYKERIRWCWKRFTPYRGDTENHFLMYYGSLLLMSQAWPELAASEWFMGKSSREIYAESKSYLEQWISETVRSGATEWNSPRYDYYYITPLVLLSQYTADAWLSHLFTNMLELELADYAVNYLGGNYTGAHSRVSEQSAIAPRNSEVAAYEEYFYGEAHERPLLEDVAFAAMSRFECPKIIRDIARNRRQPFENFEYKRGRTAIRYSASRNAPVYKYSWMTPDYCLGSMQGGIMQPIQQQSWSLVFRGSPGNTLEHNVITGLNPYVSEKELGMFFPEYPEFMLSRIEAVKTGYTSENKWEGGSPYERIHQQKNTLVALYDLPDGARYHHIDLYIPAACERIKLTDDSDRTLEQPRWELYRYDSVLVGIYMLAEYGKYDHDTRLRSAASNSGYVIFCQSERLIATDEFADLLRSTKVTRAGDRVYSSNDQGRTFDLTVLSKDSSDPRFNGILFRSPFIQSRRGSGIVTLTVGGEKRVLDFR